MFNEGIPLKSGASAATTEYISHHKYQVRPHLSSWFSAACDAAIAHRNHFFHLYQQNKFSKS